ncbi:enolase-phosphatase E1-like [Pollicipes pollicipes]|uniref:enolase-phosphatase E1-like n=1 Tax=Pollicipes pollicipes TaxID=41117 RepID=UPI001884CC0A|nr:enolase-phosphatase E1-like [Pollicipes pollicipes]
MVAPVNAVLLDIEGTTTSISFVKDILFPYAREHLDAFLHENWETDECKSIVGMLRDQVAADRRSGQPAPPLPPADAEPAVLRAAVGRYLLLLMDADRKVTALKRLQGLVWRDGYRSGRIAAHVYEDVPHALEQWRRQGLTIWIYSSGSIAAQKLLFEHTPHGSLLQQFSGHFDTTTGPKTEQESYSKIAKAIGCSPDQIMFVTDIPKEAEAASGAGLLTTLAVRPGNAALTADDRQRYATVTDLRQVGVV